MNRIWRNFRIGMFNWLGAGKVTLKLEPEELNMSSGYTYATNNFGADTITLGGDNQFRHTMTIKVTPATGGHIVSVDGNASQSELHVIADGTDFDKELGKIITFYKLKA